MTTAAPQLFESKPRWPGAPLICLAANRMAFASVAELDRYVKRYSPSVDVINVWECFDCGSWHFRATDPRRASK